MNVNESKPDIPDSEVVELTAAERKSLDNLFPYEYKGGGYFRKRGVERGESAPILHGQQALDYLFKKMQEKD